MVAKRAFIPIVGFVAAALACAGGANSSNGGPTRTPAPKVLFKDNFDRASSGWNSLDDAKAKREIRDGEYVFEVFKTDVFVWDNPGEDSLANTHIAVSARNVGDAQDPTFGVMCNYQDEDNHYYMGIGPDGYFAIVKVEATDETFLTSDEKLWVKSDDIALNADAYELEADCAKDGTLTLTVDGKEIASASDPTFTKGDVGLFVLSFDESPVEVQFDNLVVTELK